VLTAKISNDTKAVVVFSSRMEVVMTITKFDRVRFGAAVSLLVAVWLVPWTTFTDASAHVSLSYHAGWFQWPLTAVAVAILVVQTIRDRGDVPWTYPVLLSLVVLSGAISVVTALTNMSHANSNTVAGLQQSQWGYGTLLAGIAFVAFLAATLSEQPRGGFTQGNRKSA
jgi:hypothetical protein